MKKKILIVDDKDNYLETIKDILQDKYVVFVAKNSSEAIKIAKENNSIDCVLVDLVIGPNEDGVDLFLEIKKIIPNIRGTFYTGFGPEQENALISKAHNSALVEKYLRKPLFPEEIIKAIDEL